MSGQTSRTPSFLPKNPTFTTATITGFGIVPTEPQGTNNTRIANTAFVRGEIAALVDSAPATLDTLNELAAALGDDPNFATTMANALAAIDTELDTKAPIVSPTFSGDVVIAGQLSVTTDGSFGAPSAATSAVHAYTNAGDAAVALIRSANSANSRLHEFLLSAGNTFYGRFVNDAYSAATPWVTVVGSSASITSIALGGNTVVAGNITADLSGSVDVFAQALASSFALIKMGVNRSGVTNDVGAATNTAYLGSPNGVALVFGTSGVARMTIGAAGGADVAGTVTVSGDLVAQSGLLAVGSSAKQLYLRTVSGTNRIDSYDNPITVTVPLLINASALSLQISDATVVSVSAAGATVTGTLSTTGAGLIAGATADAAGFSKLTVAGPIRFGAADAHLIYNWYFDGAFKRVGADYASGIVMNGSSVGDMEFYTFGTGAAGSTITFTPSVVLKNAGRLLIGTTTDDGSSRLQVAGIVTSTAVGGGSASGLLVSSSQAAIGLRETDAGADAKQWDIEANGGVLSFRMVNDANSAANTWLSVTRSTHASATMAFTGNTSIAGTLSATARFDYPSYTVATLPAVGIAGGEIYVSNEAGGAVPAFSDGTNWRRYTDRAIVS